MKQYIITLFLKSHTKLDTTLKYRRGKFIG